MPWCRQESYRETYYRVKPLPPPTQPVQALQILPSFAKPQTLAGPDGSIVFLEPEPYLHAPLDVVNHTAGTALDSGSPSTRQQASTAKYKGQHIRMPEPMQAPLQQSDLLIAMTSAADRCVPQFSPSVRSHTMSRAFKIGTFAPMPCLIADLDSHVDCGNPRP